MIPVLTPRQIKDVDQGTIASEGISPLDLMERAARAFVKYFQEWSREGHSHIVVIAGVGNNGADALAIARLLTQEKYSPVVCIIGDTSKGSIEFKANMKRLKGIADIRIVRSKSDLPTLGSKSTVIDGILGSGLSRPLSGLYEEVVDTINQASGLVVSIDIASGLFSDTENRTKKAVKPDLTISFQLPKWPFFQPSLAQYVGQWELVSIGLSDSLIARQNTHFHLTERSDLNFVQRGTFDHKGTSGRVLLVGGSKGKMGAAVLAARAAMRSGAGLLFSHVPKCGADIMQISVPESMVLEENHETVVSEIELDVEIDAIAIGPGLGTNPFTRKALHHLMKACTCPMIIDADAINLLASNKTMLSDLPKQSILTPHPGEFKRLVGPWSSDEQKLALLRTFCREHQVNMVLKGAYSAICDVVGNIYFNPTGNAGMATAGSGDVLSGVLLGIIGQGYTSEHTLKLGVYIHGLAGDLAAQKSGKTGLIASDIIDFLPKAFKTFEK